MTARPSRPVSARRAARNPKAPHLIAADETCFAELEALIATLPLCATGRVFIEVPDASWVSDLQAPPRMTVTWLDRSRRLGPAGRECGVGHALTRAVTAWADEMLCEDDDDTTRVFLLGDPLAASDIATHLTRSLEVPASRVFALARFTA
ncbi:MAG: SIP domain-containing protein [Microbacterium sp.]|jgi:NADPH-dependent ferric siderophore reductase|nr:SIP domain-containing protein [Microbacterium sp.]